MHKTNAEGHRMCFFIKISLEILMKVSVESHVSEA